MPPLLRQRAFAHLKAAGLLLLALTAGCEGIPATVPAAPATAVPGAQSSGASFCPPPPAATPPWSALPEPLPKPPGQSALMFSYYTSGTSCLVAFDAAGAQNWGMITSPIDVWRFDPVARVLWTLVRGVDGRSPQLNWQPLAGDETRRSVDIPPGRELGGFAFSPDGRELIYTEQDRLDVPRSLAVAWQMVRLDPATQQKRAILSGQYNFATRQATRPFSGDMPKVPFGWSRGTGRVYLRESALGNRGYDALWSIQPDGTDLRRLGTDSNIALPSLSPDGLRVAYLTIDPEAPTQSADSGFPPPYNLLKVLDAAGGAALAGVSERGDGIFGDRFLAWTPDGRALLAGRSRKRTGGYLDPTPGEWVRVDAAGGNVGIWLRLDGGRDEIVDGLAPCAGGNVLVALNRDRVHTAILLDDLKGTARTLATVPGSWGTTRLVGCFL